MFKKISVKKFGHNIRNCSQYSSSCHSNHSAYDLPSALQMIFDRQSENRLKSSSVDLQKHLKSSSVDLQTIFDNRKSILESFSVKDYCEPPMLNIIHGDQILTDSDQ